jgi:hypothetical protein
MVEPNPRNPAVAVRAGRAFAELLETDAEARAAWERCRVRTLVLIEIILSLKVGEAFRQIQESELLVWDALADELRLARKQMADDLESRCLPRPKSLEDWEHLARIVKIAPRKIGRLTAREIYERATAWADRKIIKHNLRARAGGAIAGTVGTPGVSPGPTRIESADTGEARSESVGCKFSGGTMVLRSGHPDAREAEAEDPPPPIADAIDCDAIADALLQEGKSGPAKLVRFMANRDSAQWSEVAEECCREEASVAAVKSLRQRTCNALAVVRGPLAQMSRRLQFRFVDYRMVKQIGPS